MKLILASASSARSQMLRAAGYEFDVIPADIDETPLKLAADARSTPANELALALARAKAASVSAKHGDALVIGADQTLDCEGKRYSKVSNLEDAARQLMALQGRDHHLHSGVACYYGGDCLFETVDTATLTMWTMSVEKIRDYLDQTGEEILGSVGCYQIEGKGVRLFRSIEGSHFTIMGMPLLDLLGYLRTLPDIYPENLA